MIKRLSLTILFVVVAYGIDYSTEIQPIFDNNCGNCHLGNSAGGLNLSSYDDLMEGNVVVPGDHAASELYARIILDNSVSGNMPPQAAELDQSEIDLIAAWIDEGAIGQPLMTVTFNVDMSQEEIAPGEGPTLWIGTFYPTPGYIMTDDDGDDIWSYTIELEPGTYTYKFRNGWWPDWNLGSGWEDLLGQECAYGQYSDRQLVFDGYENLVLDPVCFGSCGGECIETTYSNVTFQVDMSDQDLLDTDIVYIQGTFNGWCGYCNPMSDPDGDEIWELTIELPVGEYEYLYTTNGWDGLQAGAPIGSICDWLPDDAYGNYGFVLGDEDLLIQPYCFGTCWDSCLPPVDVDVTFMVDMNGQEVSDEGVYMIGDYQLFPWSTSLMPTEMTDEDGDNIFTATIGLLSSQLVEYKFVNGSQIESDSGIGDCGNSPDSDCSTPGDDCNNRVFQIPDCQLNDNGDCVLDAVTVDADNFNSCDTVFADVSFSIDFNGTGFPNADYDQCGLNGSWNAEGDQWLGWGLILSDDNGDGIFEGMLEDLPEGPYEFVVFCSGPADGWSGWGHIIHAPLGNSCDFDPSDEYGNYGFTIVDSDLSVTYCAGTCEDTCALDCDPDLICGEALTCFGDELYPTTCGPDNCDEPITDTEGLCSDNNTEYTVTFDIDGVDDCDFLSVTGTWDNWSGWGANNDTNMQASMVDGDYEFVILCVSTENPEWYSDIWGNSTIINAPVDGACWNGDYDYANYIFSVSGSDLTVSFCAGSCDETCEEVCLNDGDVNGDGVLNVVDVVNVVSFVLGTASLGDNECHADLNADGVVNVVDIVVMVNIILGG